MTTTQSDIRDWLKLAKAEKATHMLVVCDTYDHVDYPVNVKLIENVQDVFDNYNAQSMQRVMEVYALHLDWEFQLREYRSFHFEYPEPTKVKATEPRAKPKAKPKAESKAKKKRKPASRKKR